MPAPGGVVDFRHRLDLHFRPQKMVHPQGQHLGQRLQAGAAAHHGEGQPVAEFLCHFMGQVQHKQRRGARCAGRQPVTRRVVVRQHLHLRHTQRGVGLAQKPAHVAQAAGVGLQIHRLPVGRQHPALCE